MAAELRAALATAQAQAAAAEERAVASEGRVAAAEERHQQLEAALNESHGSLQQRNAELGLVKKVGWVVGWVVGGMRGGRVVRCLGKVGWCGHAAGTPTWLDIVPPAMHPAGAGGGEGHVRPAAEGPRAGGPPFLKVVIMPNRGSQAHLCPAASMLCTPANHI